MIWGIFPQKMTKPQGLPFAGKCGMLGKTQMEEERHEPRRRAVYPEL